MTTLQVVIPFSGFYNSIHDEQFDQEISQMLDTDGSGEGNRELVNRWYGGKACFNVGLAYRDYAKAFADSFAEKLGAKWTFEKLDSPKWYNFETDRIFVNVEVEELQRWMNDTDGSIMSRIAKERHTSRDGFISYYSPDICSWGNVSTWQPEQLHTLLLAWIESSNSTNDWTDSVESNGVNIAEMYLVEGVAYTVVDSNLTNEGIRLVNIAHYLRTRAERKFI